MSHGFATNPETLLVIGWGACQSGLKEKLIEAKVLHKECKPLLCSKLTSDIPSFFACDPISGAVYARLFLHALDQVDFTYVDWSLRGYASVYLKSDEGATGEKGASGLTEETALLWEAITQDERLAVHLKRMCLDKDVHLGGCLLRLHFMLQMPPVHSWVISQLLEMSFSRVMWDEIAARLQGVPCVVQAGESGQDRWEDVAMRFATGLSLMRAAQVRIGELGLEPSFSRVVHELCDQLSDQCGQAYRELRRVWDNDGPVFTCPTEV